jgi:solute carrier family 45 protein 1/2/4
MILSILTIAWVDGIANFLTNSTSSTTYRAVLVFLTTFSTFSFWIAAQAVQVGLRALISDGYTPTEQVRASAWASSYSNLAAALGNLSACMNGRYTQPFGQAVFKNMSVLAAFCLAITVLVSCLTTAEQACVRRASEKISLKAIWKLLFGMSSQIRNICLVQFFAWGSWFPFLFYTKT